MSSSQPYSHSQDLTSSNVFLNPPEVGPSSSTESVDLVHIPLTAEQQIEMREKALRDRALKRLERRERNHQLAEEECQAGDELFDKNDFAGASARYIDATNHWSSNPEFYLKLTSAYIKCELYADAAHAATRALSFDPKSLEARYIRGVARLEQGLLPAAKIDFETVIAHDPVHALAHASLGRTLSLLQATKIGDHVLSPPPIEINPNGEPVDFSFPRYEDDKLELAEPSDTSDCNHVGNGVPCRFYNRDGCARGTTCDFSHAPDEKSVRDDFGRNVCLYYLLSSCKFGEHKCVYLHSKDALPTTYGWWNDSEQINRVKSVIELAEKKAKEQRTQELHLYREAKKARAKSQGRGKSRGASSYSKSKERSGKGKQKAKDGETADPDASTAKEETATTAPTSVKSAPAATVAEDAKELNASEVVAAEDNKTATEAEKTGEATTAAENGESVSVTVPEVIENASVLPATEINEPPTSSPLSRNDVPVTIAEPEGNSGKGDLASLADTKDKAGEVVDAQIAAKADAGQKSISVSESSA